MQNLTQASIRRPVTTVMVFLCFVVIGVISTRLIPLEKFPEVDAPFVFVNIPYPGSTPEEVERQITRPAEEALATISGIKELNTNSNEGGANVFMLFDWGEDTDIKALEASEKINSVRNQFPDDVQRIFVNKFSTADEPVLELRLSADRDISNAYELLDRKLKRPLERIEGVAQVDLQGVDPKEVRIEMHADRIAAHNVDLVQLVSRLQESDFSVSAGRLTEGNQRYMVRPVGELTTLDQVENLMVNNNGLRLRDVATVEYGPPIRRYGRHLDGTYAVGMSISKEAGANTVEVVRNIFETLNELQQDPELQGIKVYDMDNQADNIVSSLNDLLSSGLLGGLFAIIVLYLFLRRFSTTMVVTLSVPISILITIGFLYFVGLTLNILSMMGLMLAIGMLVDNAVVVTESIHRHQLLDPKNRERAANLGVKEVALAVTAGTLTTAIVFLPIIVSPADQVTLFLKHVSVAICFALLISLLISLTIVPMLSRRIKHKKKEKKESDAISRLIDRYGQMLDWLLRHRVAGFFMVLLTLLSTAIPIGFVNFDFFPDDDGDRRLRLHYHVSGTYKLERVEEAVDRVEAFLLGEKESLDIASVYTWYTENDATSTILLKEEGESTLSMDEVRERIREGLPKLTIANPTFSWRSSMGGGEGIRVTLMGESSERLAALSRDVEQVLSRIEGFKDVQTEAESGEEEVHIVVDRARASQYGFTTSQIARTVSSAMRGQRVGRYRTPNGEVDMWLKFQDTDQRTLDNLRNLPVTTVTNQQISLASLAEFRMRRGPRGINRENRQTMIGVKANLEGMTSEEGQDKIREVLANYDFPTGYSWGFGQGFQGEEESQQIMLVNFLIALVLIYLVMAALFESIIHPFTIWSSILFAIVGVLWFFMITGTTFSVMAAIGILILVGIVVNNGIVLIDHINYLRKTGLPRHDAIVQAGRDRLRPIVMTAATTVLGLIPLCIGTTQIGGDGPSYYPMARAIVGGLTFSTVVTLVILPTIYIFLDDFRFWMQRVVKR